ncbi:hypothetical protein AALP_AA7G265100 [Arabis alpina]|uniref:Eukaryotic translation initiation factor 4B3-like n=1 Tax=Arabis alpina TaxID=50452 RepID=A0A087GKR7_ARAAL|nr:hypothetical protein AALP_AA7G265100 [Arabis alpina]
MAAAVSSPWAKAGAWALEAEKQDEAELNQQETTTTTTQKTSDSSDFPSLAVAATTKTKKKKGQKISLAEFTTYGAPKPVVTERLTQAEIVSLPTGPRERSAEELERPKGFRSYGSDSPNSRWGSSRVSDDGERRSSRDRDLGPSRADENDNWAATKKPMSGGGYERRERGVGFFESSQSLSGKADEVDSWISSKPSFVPSGGGSERFEKRGGSFESLSRNRDGDRSDSDTWGRRREESFSDAAPGGGGGSRPRLVLQPRTLPAPVVEVKVESPVNVRPESPVVVVNVERVKGANPFGNARPREEVLAEKGQDWKEIEEKLEADKLKDIAAAIEKSPGKIGFGLGHGRKDEHTERSWRKSPEQTEEGAKEEEPVVEEEASKEDEASKEEEATKEEANKEETENKN